MGKIFLVTLVIFGLLFATPGLAQTTSTQEVEVPEVNLRQGDRGPAVKKIQQILKDLGYLLDVEPTEYFGPKTREAIKKFQEDNNLPATGYLGPATRKALRKKLEELYKKVDIQCIKAAVEKRENALLEAWNNYVSTTTAVRQTRKSDLLAAWSIEDPKQRNSAIKSAWEKYRESIKNAHIEWLKARNTVWVQYVKEAQNCKAPLMERESLEKVEVPEK